ATACLYLSHPTASTEIYTLSLHDALPISEYTAEECLTNRSLISEGLIVGLNEKLNDIGLYVTDVNIINFDFSDAYIIAIEEKQRSEEHTSELQSRFDLVCRLLLEKNNTDN